MDKKEWQENVNSEENLSDNIGADETNVQGNLENEEMKDADSDNVSEELAKVKDAYVRLMAEYDNYRKRTIKEKADLIKNGGEKVLIGLLSVIDDLERAKQSIDNSNDASGVKEGVDLIYNKFLSYLHQNGVKVIDAIGQPFDEDLFDAVATVPATDENMKGKVIDSVQTGYTLNDKVIRHAKVVVAN